MAILVNKGQRGFVLKEGLLAPGAQLVVENEEAEKLSRVYPKELMLIMPDPIVKPSEAQCEGPVAEKVAEPIVEEVKEEPKKRGRKAKAK